MKSFQEFQFKNTGIECRNFLMKYTDGKGNNSFKKGKTNIPLTICKSPYCKKKTCKGLSNLI